MIFFSRIISKTIDKLGKFNLPFSKYTKEEKMEYFTYFPAVIGGGCGAYMGAHDGYDMSKKEHFIYNMTFTTFGIFYGSMFGAVSGVLWPISVPVLITRYIRKGDDKK